jgi:ATP:ADP antiporter, AAA family
MTFRRLAAVRPEEARGVAWSFLYFFFLLSSYYLLRPLREARGVGVGVQNLPVLYSVTFTVMLAVAPAWAALVSRVPRRRLLPMAYRFFALNMVAFYGLSRAFPGHWLVSAGFVVWLSVFNLTAVTVLWSFMSDVWRTDQGKRLFGLIAVGGSAGAVVGPALTATLVGVLDPEHLLLIAAVLLEAGTLCLGRVAAWHRRIATAAPAPAAPAPTAPDPAAPTARAPTTPAADPEKPVGGGVLSGLMPIIRSPYLAAIAGYMLLSTLSGTFNYYLQARLAADRTADQVELTQLFARLDLATNLVTGAAQGLLAGRLLTRWGVLPGLALLPLVSAIGFSAASFWPALLLVGTLTVLRRATSYGLAIPAYGVLFTVVSREEKYKARMFIDLVVYRGGDVVGGWLFTGLLALGFGLAGAAAAGAAVAIPWMLLARYLARKQRELAG